MESDNEKQTIIKFEQKSEKEHSINPFSHLENISSDFWSKLLKSKANKIDFLF